MFRHLLLPLVAALALTAGAALADARLTIVHVNDLDQMNEVRGQGGAARLATVVKAERAAKPNVVVTHGGDMISPSLLSGFDKGKHMVALMNAIGLDVMVVGNHEFDFGPDVLAERLAEAKFAWLAGNVRRDGQPLPDARDTHMVEVAGYKVGFLGLVTTDTPFISSAGDTVDFAPVLETGKALAARLRAEGADLVIALAHLPLGQDQALMREQIGIDMVLAGHDHVLYTEYDGAGMVVQAKSNAQYVAVLDIDLKTVESRGRTRFEWTPSLRYVRTDEVTPDADIAALVQGYDDQLSTELDQPLGTTQTMLDSRRGAMRSAENALGNLIADAMRVAVDADIALTNSGGIRGDRAYEVGHTLTRRDILTELPFGNRTVKLEMTGAHVAEMLEHGLSVGDTGGGRFPQISGMTVTWNPTKPVGSRVTSVTVGGTPLDPATTYSVATNDFLARGGDGYAIFVGRTRLIDPSSARLMAAQVMDYVTQLGEVAPTVEGRISTP